MNSNRKQYPSICKTALDHCTQLKASLKLKPDVRPVFKPKRPIPYAAIEQELDRLENKRVILRVNYSIWAARMVVVKKASWQLRICADFSIGLNDSLELLQYPLPNPENINTRPWTEAGYFQKLTSPAYTCRSKSKTTAKFLTIDTHKGFQAQPPTLRCQVNTSHFPAVYGHDAGRSARYCSLFE